MNAILPLPLVAILAVPAWAASEPGPVVFCSLADCNVTWASPSGDPFSSTSLGNGDVGVNVRVESHADLVFYFGKVDAFDAGPVLPKPGRARLRLESALNVRDVWQSLLLRGAAVSVQAGDVDLRVWVDANASVVRVEGTTQFHAPRLDAQGAKTKNLGATACIHEGAARLCWG